MTETDNSMTSDELAPSMSMRAESSPSIAQLAAALAAAQAEMEGAKKDAKNDHFRNRYADLASCWDAWRAAGPKHGLAIIQIPESRDPRAISLRTMLVHKSGEFIACTLSMPIAQQNAHAVGSAITYARRYAFAALVGIAPEEDDGNAASGRNAPTRVTSERAPEPSPDDLEAAQRLVEHLQELETKESLEWLWKTDGVAIVAKLGGKTSEAGGRLAAAFRKRLAQIAEAKANATPKPEGATEDANPEPKGKRMPPRPTFGADAESDGR